MDISKQLARLDQANRRGAELGAAIQEWASGHPWDVAARIADDRLSWELVLGVSTPPPLDSWGLAFGEAVHHLRALLDNAVVAIARANGITERGELRRLQFPISGSAKEWSRDRSRIAPLPSTYQLAIERIQPFQRFSESGTPDQDLLLMLRDLDNQDKHHIYVAPVIEPAELQHNMSVEFETEKDAAKSVPPDVTVFGVSFDDGQPLLRWTTKGRIAKVKGSCNVSAQVRLELPDGTQRGLNECLAGLCYYTGVVLNYLAVLDESSI